MAALYFRDCRLHSFCIRDYATATGHSLYCFQYSAISVQSTGVYYLERVSANQRACNDPYSFRGHNHNRHCKTSSLNEWLGGLGHETGWIRLFADNVVLLLINIGVDAEDAEDTLLGGALLLWGLLGCYLDDGARD